MSSPLSGYIWFMSTLTSKPYPHKGFRHFQGLLTNLNEWHGKCVQFVNIREGDRNMPHGTPHRRKGPGRFERESVSLIELTKMFPTERAARLWLEKSVWPDGPVCPYCGSAGRAAPKPNGPRTHRCSDRNCNRWFSVKTGSVMKALHLSCKQWAIGMHLFCCNLIGHSSLHRRRNFGMTQKSAWFLGHRLREAHQNRTEAPFAVPGDLEPDEVAVEVDEASLGGSETNRHQRNRKGMRGATEDKAVVGRGHRSEKPGGRARRRQDGPEPGRGARAGLRRGRHPSREHRHDGPVRGLQEPRPPPGIGKPLGRPICPQHGPCERDRIVLGQGVRGLQGDIHQDQQEALAALSRQVLPTPQQARGLHGHSRHYEADRPQDARDASAIPRSHRGCRPAKRGETDRRLTPAPDNPARSGSARSGTAVPRG